MKKAISRDRLQMALNQQITDHIPCSFMSFAIMRHRCNDDWYKVAENEQAMGLDPFLFIPSAPRVSVRITLICADCQFVSILMSKFASGES